MADVYGPYRARVDSVHDGDTVYLTIDLGFDHEIESHNLEGHPQLSCRVLGINAPELATAEGKAAADYARTLLPAGGVVQVVSHGWDKFGGRFDGEITLPNGQDFGQEMIRAGHAVAVKS